MTQDFIFVQDIVWIAEYPVSLAHELKEEQAA